MLKLILKGGLGNQMFQYAATRSLATHLKTDFEINLSFMNNRLPVPGFTMRDYELDIFGLAPKLTTLTNIPLMEKYFSYPLIKVKGVFSGENHYIEKDPYAFDEHFFELKENTTIEGFFNNTRYFENISEDIKKDFDLDKFYNPEFKEFEDKVTQKNAVSINIRRGDYLNSKHQGIYTYLNENYYKEAMKKIAEKVENPHYYVFSYDDPEWFKETFKLDSKDFAMVGKEYVGDKFRTYLRLISLCKHNIISNSTFAFWGAYLNKNPKKEVVCPINWSKVQAPFEIPQGWTGIEVKNS